MKRIVFAGILTLAIMLQSSLGLAVAGNRTAVQVSATVLPSTSQTIIRQPATLTVTPQDMAKGFVDVSAGTVVRVRSNDLDGYYFNFSIDGQYIRATEVLMSGRSVMIPSGSGLVHQPFPGLTDATIHIGYRFFISPNMEPGTYAWPIDVSAERQ